MVSDGWRLAWRSDQRRDETPRHVAKFAREVGAADAEDVGDVLDRSDLSDDTQLVRVAKDRTVVRYADIGRDGFHHEVDFTQSVFVVRRDNRLVVRERGALRQGVYYESKVHS